MLFPTSYVMKPPIGAQPILGHPLTPNVAAWIMNEGSGNKIYDIIGRNHGTFGAGVAAPTWMPGRTGPALDFDGTDDYVDCGNNASLDTPNAFTTLIWWKRLGASGGSFSNTYHTLINHLNRADSGENNILISSDGTTLLSRVGIGGISKSDSASISSPNNWHCVGTIWDGNHVYTVLDGKIGDSPSAASGVLDSGTSNLVLGRITSTYWIANGIFGGGGIWDWALSASQIRQLYVDPYCWLAQPMEAELMYAAPPVGVMSPYYYETLMAGAVI